MIITCINIQNLRCVKNDSLVCDLMVSLVGRNGAGKSCFLHALRLFYAVSPTVTEEDYYNRVTSDPIVIRVTFAKLTAQEAEAFKPYLNAGELTVTKKIMYVDGQIVAKTYAASRQHPEFANVRSLEGKREQKEAFNALVERGLIVGLTKATSAIEAEAKMAEWEVANAGACHLIDREAQFFGAASVGIGSLDTFTKFVFIPAVRDVAEEAGEKRGSALASLLELVVNERVDSRPDLKKRLGIILKRSTQKYSQRTISLSCKVLPRTSVLYSVTFILVLQSSLAGEAELHQRSTCQVSIPL